MGEWQTVKRYAIRWLAVRCIAWLDRWRLVAVFRLFGCSGAQEDVPAQYDENNADDEANPRRVGDEISLMPHLERPLSTQREDRVGAIQETEQQNHDSAEQLSRLSPSLLWFHDLTRKR